MVTTSTTLKQFIPPSESVAIYKGDTFQLVLTVKDSAGTLIDLTGATGQAQLKDATNTTVDSFTVTTGGTAGTITLTLSNTDTAALPVGTLKSDVQITSGGTVTTYLVLRCRVLQDVTA